MTFHPAEDPPHLSIEVASDPSLLCGLRELVNRLARTIGFSEIQSSQVALAVDEALANVIRHGYDNRIDARIWLSIWTLAPNEHGPGLRVIIEDQARQVDPATIKSRELDDIRPGGLGVHIIREVMDETRYEKRNGAGMRLTLEKRTSTPGKASRPGVACLTSAPPCDPQRTSQTTPESPNSEPGKDHA
jgi:anti-sigma regulatory factor (Ser/Thr protein kinase)